MFVKLLFVPSVRWCFFVFRNSVEKFCVSWVFPLIECVAVWALKLPVVSAPLRSLHNRSPPDFLQLIPTYSKPTRHKVFLQNYWNPKEPTANICHPPVTSYLSLIKQNPLLMGFKHVGMRVVRCFSDNPIPLRA